MVLVARLNFDDFITENVIYISESQSVWIWLKYKTLFLSAIELRSFGL
jgi:hypothetical protein